MFWRGEPQAAGFAGLLATFLSRAGENPRWLRRLIEAWLRDFSPSGVAFVETGRAIARLLRTTDDPRLQPWAQAHQRYGLFDAMVGPGRVAGALLQGAGAVLPELGMDDAYRAEGLFFRAVLAALLEALPDALRRRDGSEVWPRAAAVLAADGKLRHDGLERAAAVADRSLAVWLEPKQHAAPKKEIQGFLLRHIGDPRLQPENWRLAREETTSLMRSWLAEATLEAFFKLISDMNTGERWEYRRDFWRACLRKMRSAEVWVVLGSALARRVKSKRDLADSHGHLIGGGSDDQALLVIRLGGYVFTEWSDSGRLRAYSYGDPSCPRLYVGAKDYYDVRKLKRPDSLPFPRNPTNQKSGSDQQGLSHQGADTGLWQGSAAEFMLKRLNLRLDWTDYMPQ